MSIRAAAVLSTLLTQALVAQQIHVAAGAPPGGNGQTWATAHASLQVALNQATPGSTVWVAAGLYQGSFTAPAGIRVLGGFQPGASREDQARPAQFPTVLDGLGTARVIELGNGTTLDGFVLRNGRAPAPGGGGTLVDGTTVTIRRCEFTGNTVAAGDGTGLYVVNGGDPLVVDCLFHHNANTGHAIAVENFGRGTYDQLTVVDNLHNGMFLQNGAMCRISNSIFARNHGRGICDFANGAPNQPMLRNCLFWQNTVSLMHVTGTELHTLAAVNALPYASANVAGDPSFVGAADYRLLAGSPAIDRGTAAPLDGRLEWSGNPRTLDGDLDGSMLPDIGAVEYGAAVLSATGSAVAGGQLTVQLTGAPGLVGFLGALLPDAPVLLPPFGALHGNSPVVVALGPLPSSVSLPLPPGLVADVVLQGFALGSSGASLTNPLAFAIR